MFVMNEHIAVCNKSPVPPNIPLDPNVKIAILDDEKRAFQAKATSLETQIQKLNETLMKLRLSLKYEGLLNATYGEIIRHYTPINPDDIIKVKNDKLHIFKTSVTKQPEGMKLEVVLHENNHEQIEKLVVKKPKLLVKKKDVYKKVKNAPSPIIDEEGIDKFIEETDKAITKTKDSYFDLSPTTFKAEFDKVCLTLETTRTYKCLDVIKPMMNKLLGRIPLTDYCDLLHSNVDTLTQILTKRKLDAKKIREHVRKTLSSLDMRLAKYSGYHMVHLEVDDFETFKSSLTILHQFPKKHVRFDFPYHELLNYGLAIFPLRFCIERLLINTYGFHNIIYAKLQKSTGQDPYSFYTLRGDEDGKHHWDMDCRLENLTLSMMTRLNTYCVALFRELYKAMFSDNDYRSDFTTFGPIVQTDCDQLLKTLAITSDFTRLNNLLKEIVMKNSSVELTSIDKLNLQSDDAVQRKRFKTEEFDDEQEGVVRKLFDNVKTGEAQGVYEKLCD